MIAIMLDIMASVEPQQIGDFAFGVVTDSLGAGKFVDDRIA